MADITLQDWMNNHPVGLEMLWKGAAHSQLQFVRDMLHYLIVPGHSAVRKDHPVRVVSTHTSKSVLLPVYELTTPEWDGGYTWDARELAVRLRMRNNFYNWVVSVESNRWVHDRFRDLFDREEQVLPVYAEGFEAEWVFPPYAESRDPFTVSLPSNYDLYTFCWLLRHS